MQHWTGISRRHVFVAVVSVLIAGTSGRAVAGDDWTRAVTDYDWSIQLA